MLVLTLSTLLSAAPAAEPFNARLVGEHARPLGTGTLLAQAEVPPPLYDAPRAPVSLSELRERIQVLEDSKPKLGGWIAMLSIGVPVAVFGIGLTVYLVTTVGGGYYGIFLLLEILTGALGFIGVALAVVGTVLLAVMATKRGRISEEQDALRAQLEAAERSGVPDAPRPPPPSDAPPPPPPPPPSSVERNQATQPALVLASF